MNEQQNIDLVRKIYSMFARRDIPAIMACFSHDIDWEAMVGVGDRVPTGGRRRGLERTLQFFGALEQNIEFQQFEVREFIAQGSNVVTLGFYRGTVKPTGRTFYAEWAMLLTIEGGKVTRFREFTDTNAIVTAFGVPVNA